MSKSFIGLSHHFLKKDSYVHSPASKLWMKVLLQQVAYKYNRFCPQEASILSSNDFQALFNHAQYSKTTLYAPTSFHNPKIHFSRSNSMLILWRLQKHTSIFENNLSSKEENYYVLKNVCFFFCCCCFLSNLVP